jgi:hypothetical protein
MEEKMKKVVLAVIAIGFLAVSCGGGGGNIKKVQNGVFSNYDNTITVGKALENNSLLKGGKWEAIKMDGRDYVTYTVRLTGAQVQELLPEALSSANWMYKNKPNLGSATEFRSFLNRIRGVSGNTETLASLTSMTAAEINMAIDIITAKLKAYEQPTEDNFFNYSDIIEGEHGKQRLNDDFLDPYLHTIKDKIILLSPTYVEDSSGTTRYAYPGELEPQELNNMIYSVVRTYIWRNDPDLLIENGMLTGDAKSKFDNTFGKTNYADDKDLIAALIRTRTRYYDWHIKAKEDYRKAMAEYDERRNKDIEPLLTVDGYSLILSFIMNQDDTFDTNMMEGYTDITLNCFDNLKVKYNSGNSDGAQIILSCIYRGFTPKFF